MDDIYDNLENYNDVNIIEEIKNENQELKVKLEEYSKAMVQLQKDFDKVNTEYKNLEKNYSSLLKTARAEIERKTETIKKLNLEKDMFVIQTMQKKGRNVINSSKSRFNSQEKDIRNSETVLNKGTRDSQNKEISTDSNTNKDKRVEANHTPSLDTISTVSVDDKSTCSDEKGSKSNGSNESNKNKNNLSKDSHQCDTKHRQTRSNMISSRRKSTTAISIQEPKFSSDEDSDRRYPSNRRKSRPRNNSIYNRQDTRDYRTTDLHDSDLLKESHRNNSHKHLGYDNYRNVDQYDSYQRHRRPYSPVQRNQHRHNTENENYQLRGAYGNQRVLRSPPSDKYNRSKSRDRRFHFDDHRDFDNNSNRYYDHSSLKQRMKSEFDEPNSKRRKLDSHTKCTTESIDYNKDRERDVSEKTNLPLQECFKYSSCQSPDHIMNVDTNIPQHFIKEIKTTAKTKLEDPRKLSKKYILKTCNDIPILTTAVGRDIDLKSVNKSVWGIKIVDVPKSLFEPPAQESDKLLKEIHMDLDKADFNESFESEEKHNVQDDLTTFYSKKMEEDYEKEVKNVNKSKACDIQKETIEDDKGETKQKNSEKSVKPKFTIPKIKKPDKYDVEKGSKSRDTSVLEKSLENSRDPRKISSSKDCNFTEEDNSLGKKHELLIKNIEQKHIPDKVNNKKRETNDIENFTLDKGDIDKQRQEIISTIEGDLELSDEASDIIDLHKDLDYNLDQKEPNALLNIDKASTDSGSLKENKPNALLNIDKASTDSGSLKENKPNASKSNKANTKEGKNKSSTSKRVSKKDKDSPKEINKKHKSKRKSSENKHKNSESQKQQNEDNVKILDKTEECKQSIAKQTSSKFSDLFGDSNSLITPDDLGINNVQDQPADKYTLIFDNTQDAVDLNIEDITKKHSDTKEANNLETVFNELDSKNYDNSNRISVNVTVFNGNDEEKLDDKDININGVYENATSETLMESSIVKTVIISSGVQPEPAPDHFKSSTIPAMLPIVDDVLVKKCPLNNIKALATSTPQKIENGSLQKNTACTTNISKPTDNSFSNMSDSSTFNETSETQTEADIPDVRIFVRRRRKVIKKVS